MALALSVREKIEATLAGRAQMRLAPRLVCSGLGTGYETLDAVLRGGLPVAGTSELVGERTSGRASVAAAYVAERSREGQVCAWIDLGGELDGEACVANGVDLERLLVVRCVGALGKELSEAGLGVEVKSPIVLYRKDKSIGTPGVQNRRFVEPSQRVEPVDTDRMGSRRGMVILERRNDTQVVAVTQPMPVGRNVKGTRPKKPWGRMEQGVKAVDLLIQAGGFGTIVFDLGSVAPEFARRIPLATWFRWRAALERTRTSLLVLSQMGCAGSSAELVLRVQAELPEAGTVFRGGTYRLEVVRRRFAEAAGQRRGPQRADTSAWASRATWSA